MSIISSDKIKSYQSTLNIFKSAICFDQFMCSTCIVNIYAYRDQMPTIDSYSTLINMQISLTSDPSSSATEVNNTILTTFNSTLTSITLLINFN